MPLYTIEVNNNIVDQHLPYEKARKRAIYWDNFYEHKFMVDLIQEPEIPDTKDFELAQLQNEIETDQEKIDRIIFEADKEQFTNNMNESWLDQLMEEFFWTKNSLDDKIDFMTDMLNYYKIIKERKTTWQEQKPVETKQHKN